MSVVPERVGYATGQASLSGAKTACDVIDAGATRAVDEKLWIVVWVIPDIKGLPVCAPTACNNRLRVPLVIDPLCDRVAGFCLTRRGA